jgi:hypothetical protein
MMPSVQQAQWSAAPQVLLPVLLVPLQTLLGVLPLAPPTTL